MSKDLYSNNKSSFFEDIAFGSEYEYPKYKKSKKSKKKHKRKAKKAMKKAEKKIYKHLDKKYRKKLKKIKNQVPKADYMQIIPYIFTALFNQRLPYSNESSKDIICLPDNSKIDE